MRLGAQELVLLLLIVMLLFGATRLPKLARSLREARDEFQKGADDVEQPKTPPTPQPTPEAAPPAEAQRPPDGAQT